MAGRDDIMRGLDWSALWGCRSQDDWDAALIDIKSRHQDTLPPDWAIAVEDTNFAGRIQARWTSNGHEPIEE